jgi:dTDP-4-amino-4,6-dideoxygalactose transaminase
MTGYKCNMTDIASSIGLVQLDRYNDLLEKRKIFFDYYSTKLNRNRISIIPHNNSAYHLLLVRLNNLNESQRNEVIFEMANKGISTNVHYKPLPLFTAYKNLGFNIKYFPNSYDFYKNEITLPLHTLLTIEDIDYICNNLNEIVQKF